ncbi:hypothetical protein P170DRAFT_355635 [Aspergillus steynii IBT 23096]|uniref:Uncharacterized protein n=1 Tax=Aspergillus steynii IBT 23096 TaxID=1392250 RepID=A0A2I2GE35_9EURO|nr:uncharacterized protein P170DRAFT_355635 [Aspergillus steynii IBT 23096]PLB51087.1 hypothetical protein P170DRAFT_355635 [Aspergillus steynii IBT 23096]
MSSTRICHHSKKHFESKVDDLVRKYTKISEPGEALRHILQNEDESTLLIQAVRRQIALIRCRSQAPEDDQITMYDKALLVLTRHGKDPGDIGALELYVTEFLGIVPISPASQSKNILSQHVELQAILNRGSARASETESFAVPENRLPRNQQPRQNSSDRRLHSSENTDPNERQLEPYNREVKSVPRRSNTSHSQGVRDQTERILGVFYEARRDYFEALQTDGFASTTTIRFLRDTAENALLYFRQNAMMNHDAVSDLQKIFAIARDKAAELCGGRKRHFDDENKHTHKRSRRAVDSYRPSGH